MFKGVALGACLLLCVGGGALQAGVLYRERPFERVPHEVATHPKLDSLWGNAPIEVVAFFSHACAWCYRADAALEAWEANLPEEVRLVRVPVVFQKGWEELARAFYVARIQERMQPIHKNLFEALHRSGEQLWRPDAMALWMAKQGIPDYAQLRDTFAVAHSLRQAQEWMLALRVLEIPLFFVRRGPGEVWVTSLIQTEGTDQLIDTLNELISSEQSN